MKDILINAILFKALGGLGIFLLGMKFMSEGMQAVAGKRLRTLIGAVTNNRFMACAVGTLVTCLVQSSSVTTVMVVGFVNSGFMTLMQAIGVIIGANIGTTITGWILALKIGRYGLPILGISAFVYLFSKNERTRYIAMATVGIGMVFFGLETMAAGFKNTEVKQALTTIFAAMDGATYYGLLKCAAIGCVATMIIQSSSAGLGITLALATSGVIQFETAAGIILGLNIGTTITAFLASLGANTTAKRAAYAHIIFNLIGTIWLLPFFYQYLHLIQTVLHASARLLETFSVTITGDDIATKIALTHTGFNVINTIVFLPLMGILAKIVTRMVPEKEEKETPHLTFLDVRMLDTPAIGIQQSFVEVLQMGEHINKMAGMLKSILTEDEPDEKIIQKVFHREEILDTVQKEIIEFLSHLMSGNIPHDVVDAARMHLRISDEYESISDYIAAILKLNLKLRNANITVSSEGQREIMELHNAVFEYVKTVNEAVAVNNKDVLGEIMTDGDNITQMMKESRSKHLARVESQQVSPLKSLVFTDMLTDYRKIKDHVLNIAEALAGEK
ncbi:MAG: Na/Pi cotransporter family protein [Kiritimatiellae bacterium]|nr:Na/Pi cotransporter family protein [Kiritimatiellia bacterium]